MINLNIKDRIFLNKELFREEILLEKKNKGIKNAVLLHAFFDESCIS